MAQTLGVTFVVTCPNEPCKGGYIYGTGTYTRDSHMCKAGKHYTGSNIFEATFIGNFSKFRSETINGISSLGYEPYYEAFRIKAPTPAPTPAPSCSMLVCEADFVGCFSRDQLELKEGNVYA